MRRPEYVYQRLESAILAVGQNKVNFFGVIAEYDYPKPTTGSDFICTMTVMDMSEGSPADDHGCSTSLRMVIFAPELGQIPQVRAIGDIIRIHRAEITVYNRTPQATVKLPKSAFLLFDGEDVEQYEPYQASSMHYSFEPCEHRMLDLVRSWTKNCFLNSGPSQYSRPISHVTSSDYFDLCCKVIHVGTGDGMVWIYIWDGTDVVLPPIIPSDFSGENFETKACPYPLPPLEELRRSPLRGTILPVIVENPHQLVCVIPKSGNWFKLRNVSARVHNCMLEIVLSKAGKVSMLSNRSSTVEDRERSYQRRLLQEMELHQWCPEPLQSLTVTEFDHIRPSTLREVLASSQVTFKFRCIVRVVSLWPSMAMDFCDKIKEAKDSGNNAGEECRGTFTYRVRLTLEDPTARIHAYLYGKDATQFFNGHPAGHFHQHNDVVGTLQRKVYKLLGITGDSDHAKPRQPPWIKCCIKSYYLDKLHPWESRMFQIFGTTFPG